MRSSAPGTSRILSTGREFDAASFRSALVQGPTESVTNVWSAGQNGVGKPNKTDKLDAEGLAIPLRNGTLPEVWIPPIALRDQRELLRLRMFLVALRTDIKNRIHGALGRYNVQIGVTDLFGVEGRRKLEQRMCELLVETRESVRQQLITHDFLESQVEQITHG